MEYDPQFGRCYIFYRNFGEYITITTGERGNEDSVQKFISLYYKFLNRLK